MILGESMTEKNVLLGFVLVATVLFMSANLVFVGIIVDLFVLAAYILSKYGYVNYKMDGNYLEKQYMIPLYMTIAMAVLTAGIFSILGRYAILFSDFSVFFMLSFGLRAFVLAELFFMVVFAYLLFRTILVDFLELHLVLGRKGEKNVKPIRGKAKAVEEEKVAVFPDVPVDNVEEKDELYPYQIKKLPVVVMVDREE